MKKLYLDTCIISGLIRSDLGDQNNEAIKKILLMDCCVVTSNLAKTEICQIPEEFRKDHEDLCDRINKIPTIKEFHTNSGLLLMGAGGGLREDSLFSTLKKILPDENDARHIFQAIKNNVTDFITIDQKTILNRSLMLKTVTNINFSSPFGFMGLQKD